MKFFTSPAMMVLALAGCASAAPLTSPPARMEDGLSRTALGRTVAVGGPKVTPLAILEDSRCPVGVTCVWAGRVRISVRVDLGRGSEMHELTQGVPIPVADGTLELVEVEPSKPQSVRNEIKPDVGHSGLSPRDYRFGFRFMGGL
jgi:hypothetical protein